MTNPTTALSAFELLGATAGIEPARDGSPPDEWLRREAPTIRTPVDSAGRRLVAGASELDGAGPEAIVAEVRR